MKLSKQINSLKEKLNDLKLTYLDELKSIYSDTRKLSLEANIIPKKWAGSWYKKPNIYHDFTGLVEEGQLVKVSYEDILTFAQNKSKVDAKEIWERSSEILDVCKEFNEELIIELSVIRANDQFEEQVKLLEKLESFEWGYPETKFIENQRPKQFLGDIHTAQKIFAHGYEIPPHISFNANVISKASQITAIEDYFKLSYRLLRELQLILNIDMGEFEEMENHITILDRLFDKFHDVARQLVNRHSGRSTIIIEDEYDVQDLLHALLKINFDDVRPEDYTPSYAGRNTRIDFLLKKERIVIEVKKTRDTLKDKEIGDELLQDIARYKNHPDCDVLYCFVYDPQGLISNPRGLENDLDAESNESLKVITRIKP